MAPGSTFPKVDRSSRSLPPEGRSSPYMNQWTIYFLSTSRRDRSRLLVLNKSFVPEGNAAWTLPVLGGAARRLGNVVATDASWSADGDKLAYTSGKDLYIANATALNLAGW